MDQPKCYIPRHDQTEAQQRRQDMLEVMIRDHCYPFMEAEVLIATGEKCDPNCPACHGEDDAYVPAIIVRETIQN